MKKLLSIALLFCFLPLVFARAELPTRASAITSDLYTFQGIPWDTPPNQLIDVFYEKTGIILKHDSIYYGGEDQKISILGLPVERIHILPSIEKTRINHILITFLPKFDQNNLDFDSSVFDSALSDFLALYNALIEKYGPYYKAFLDQSNPDIPSYYIKYPISMDGLRNYVQLIEGNEECSLSIGWRNITLRFRIFNHEGVFSYMLGLAYRDHYYDYKSLSIMLLDLNTLTIPPQPSPAPVPTPEPVNLLGL